jgi:hypothetical protein
MPQESKNLVSVLEEQVYAAMKKGIRMGFLAGYRIAKQSGGKGVVRA